MKVINFKILFVLSLVSFVLNTSCFAFDNDQIIRIKVVNNSSQELFFFTDKSNDHSGIAEKTLPDGFRLGPGESIEIGTTFEKPSWPIPRITSWWRYRVKQENNANAPFIGYIEYVIDWRYKFGDPHFNNTTNKQINFHY